VGDRLIDLPLQTESDRQVPVCLPVARIDLEHAPQVGDCFVDASSRPEQDSKIEMRIGIVAIQRNRAPILGDRRLDVTRRVTSVSEVEADAIVIGLQPSGRLEIDECLREPALRLMSSAKVAARFRIVSSTCSRLTALKPVSVKVTL
jgi:hypothetical protein